MNCVICGRSTGSGDQDTCGGVCWLEAVKRESYKGIRGYFEIPGRVTDVF